MCARVKRPRASGDKSWRGSLLHWVSERELKPAKFKYVRAETADHAVELLGGADTAARILAGGQSLIPALSARSVIASLLLDIMRCPGLNDVMQTPDEVTVGAACRQSWIELSPVV